MSIETEIKVKIDDAAAFCRRLDALNPGTLAARHFEDNYLLDFSDLKLKAGRSLLRLRFAESRSFLTYKGAPCAEGIFKTREELETTLEDGAMMLQILARIGMSICFRYQKYRCEFEVAGVHVAIDETPIGNYAEFEGSEEGIRNLANKMEIAESQFVRLSYYSLYLDYCRAKGVSPAFMVF